MVIDFRKNKSVIPPLEVNGHVFERVKSCKLLGMWIDNNLKWKTNVKYLVKKAAKRLFALKILRNYNALYNYGRFESLLHVCYQINP
jgi:hypothetical protein